MLAMAVVIVVIPRHQQSALRTRPQNLSPLTLQPQAVLQSDSMALLCYPSFEPKTRDSSRLHARISKGERRLKRVSQRELRHCQDLACTAAPPHLPNASISFLQYRQFRRPAHGPPHPPLAHRSPSPRHTPASLAVIRGPHLLRGTLQPRVRTTQHHIEAVLQLSKLGLRITQLL